MYPEYIFHLLGFHYLKESQSASRPSTFYFKISIICGVMSAYKDNPFSINQSVPFILIGKSEFSRYLGLLSSEPKNCLRSFVYIDKIVFLVGRFEILLVKRNDNFHLTGLDQNIKGSKHQE